MEIIRVGGSVEDITNYANLYQKFSTVGGKTVEEVRKKYIETELSKYRESIAKEARITATEGVSSDEVSEGVPWGEDFVEDVESDIEVVSNGVMLDDEDILITAETGGKETKWGSLEELSSVAESTIECSVSHGVFLDDEEDEDTAKLGETFGDQDEVASWGAEEEVEEESWGEDEEDEGVSEQKSDESIWDEAEEETPWGIDEDEEASLGEEIVTEVSENEENSLVEDSIIISESEEISKTEDFPNEDYIRNRLVNGRREHLMRGRDKVSPSQESVFDSCNHGSEKISERFEEIKRPDRYSVEAKSDEPQGKEFILAKYPNVRAYVKGNPGCVASEVVKYFRADDLKKALRSSKIVEKKGKLYAV